MNKFFTGLAAVALPCAAFAGAYGDMFRDGHLRFDYSPQEIASLEECASEELEKNLAALTAVPASRRDFNNTVLALETAYTQYWFVPKNLSLLAYFHKDADVRDLDNGVAVASFLLRAGNCYKYLSVVHED